MRQTDRNGRPKGTRQLMERQPIPGNQPGMADHAPNRRGGGGGGPGAEHRIFATFPGFSRVFPGFSVLDAQDVIHDALILRFTVALELDAQDAMGDALILRFRTPCVTL